MNINQYIKVNFKSSWIIVLLSLFGSWAFAQGEAELRMKFGADSVRLGIPVDLNIQLLVPANSSLRALELSLDSIKTLQGMNPADDSSQVNYEIVNYGSWTPAKNNRFFPRQLNWTAQDISGGKQAYQNTLKIVIWEPGIFVLPAARAEVELPQGPYDIYSNDQTIMIGLPDVNQLSGIDSSGLAPLKPIFREAPKSILGSVLAVFFGLLLLGALVYYFFFYRKAPVQEEIVIPPTADETALAALAKIEQQGDWKKGLLKKYYDELTHVIRAYLEERYEIKALESTTDEILRDLNKIDIKTSWVDGLKRLLPMTDMVKFAKMQPTDEEHTKWLDWSRSMILVTKKEIVNIEESSSINEQ